MDTYIETAANLANIITLRETPHGHRQGRSPELVGYYRRKRCAQLVTCAYAMIQWYVLNNEGSRVGDFDSLLRRLCGWQSESLYFCPRYSAEWQA